VKRILSYVYDIPLTIESRVYVAF